MWRPKKDWEKTLREILDRFNVTYMNSEECKLIEAGADAILEAIKSELDKCWNDNDKILVIEKIIGGKE